MGLKEKQENLYVRVSKGAFWIKTDSSDKKAIASRYKDDEGNEKITYRRKYGEVSGLVTDIYYTSNEFGGKLNIVIEDDNRYILQLPDERKLTNFVINLLLNDELDFSKEISFIARTDKSKYTTVFVIQNNKYIKAKYSKANNNIDEVPTAKKIKRGNITKWDFTDANTFFAERVEKELAPKIREIHGIYNKDYENKPDTQEYDEQPGDPIPEDPSPEDPSNKIDFSDKADDLPF